MAFVSWVWRKLGKWRWAIIWFCSPKFVVGVSAVIIVDGKVWLQQHRFWPNQAWGLPGGLVKSGELPEVALRREIFEETGLDCEIGSLISSELFFRRGITLFYTVSLKPGTLTIDTKEILAAEYVELSHLPATILPSHKQLLQNLPISRR